MSSELLVSQPSACDFPPSLNPDVKNTAHALTIGFRNNYSGRPGTQDHGRYGRHKNHSHTIALFLTAAHGQNSKVVGTETDESSDVTMNYKDTDLTVEASGGKGTNTSTPCKYEKFKVLVEATQRLKSGSKIESHVLNLAAAWITRFCHLKKTFLILPHNVYWRYVRSTIIQPSVCVCVFANVCVWRS